MNKEVECGSMNRSVRNAPSHGTMQLSSCPELTWRGRISSRGLNANWQYHYHMLCSLGSGPVDAMIVAVQRPAQGAKCTTPVNSKRTRHVPASRLRRLQRGS